MKIKLNFTSEHDIDLDDYPADERRDGESDFDYIKRVYEEEIEQSAFENIGDGVCTVTWEEVAE